MHNSHMAKTNWDDLRLFHALVEAGGVTAAADRLGLNHTTLYRRLAALEESLGAQLFERRGRSLSLTAAGEELAAAAERMDLAAGEALTRLAGRDLEAAGTVRVTAPDDLMHYAVIPAQAEFQALHPRIKLELAVDNRHLNLTRREADVAVRATAAPQETLVGRRAFEVRTGLFRPAGYATLAWEDWSWAAWEEGAGPVPSASWMAAKVRPDQVRLRANSMLSLARAVESGAGACLLPTFLGRRLNGVIEEPMTEPIEDRTSLWVLTHPDLRRSVRIRLATDFLFAKLRGLAPA